jgi:hypothetical protein
MTSEERVLNIGELRQWATTLRSAADVLNPPSEVEAAVQYGATLPDDLSPEELQELVRLAGGERWQWASELRFIAAEIDFKIES